jgi:hypothetical protein
VSATSALAWAHDQVGTKEQPAGSNWGPKISDWIKASGYSYPVPWCQCFANAVAIHGGAPQLKTGYTPYVLAGNYTGFDPVPLSQAQPGDMVFYKWPGLSSAACDHVGILLSLTATTVTCIEGNTSLTSQNNGGQVMIRTRSRSLVAGAVSVLYTGSISAPFRSLTSGDEGADVRAFQTAVNKRADGCGRPDRRCIVDGVVGAETLANGAWAAWILGIGDSQAELRSGGISSYVQTLVRDPDERNETQKSRAGNRREEAGCKGGT